MSDYLSEDGRKLAVIEVRDGGNTAAVLRKFLQATFELVESCQTKQVHLLVGRFLQRLQHIAESQTQRHITGGRR